MRSHRGPSWRPGVAARFFVPGARWALDVTDRQFALQIAGTHIAADLVKIQQLACTPGWLWAALNLALDDGRNFRLEGLAKGTAHRLIRTLNEARVATCLADLPASFGPLLAWVAKTEQDFKTELARSGWLSHEFVRHLTTGRPNPFGELLHEPAVQARLASEPMAMREAIATWSMPLSERARAANKRLVERELVDSARFFATIEKSPLTEEQSRAVLCFDSRVLLVAAAGSGKTSTLIAKAGYALMKGYAGADEILLLAFNANAAAEMRERLARRLTPLGLPGRSIRAMTFHAFGLDVIAEVTGAKPTVAPWVADGREVEYLLGIVEYLRGHDDRFHRGWNEFRSLFAEELPAFDAEFGQLNQKTLERDRPRFRTANGELVRSRGEQRLADWLFYNGIRYEYERPYEHPTATRNRRQYCPDFYLPDIPAYLEHWALNEAGRPPPAFAGYAEGMAWKKGLHQQHRTTLLETTMAGVWDGTAFSHLEAELIRHGLTLQPQPERMPLNRSARESRRLGALFRAGLVHAKSNRLTIAGLRARAQTEHGSVAFRHRMFLNLLEPIWAEWDKRLRQGNAIDFEDMLNLAADCVERGDWHSPYALVLADEYQDASHARVRLLHGLSQRPGTRLFAVGDDWQGINRFAGADLSAMTAFGETFKDAVIMHLETTFRCPQSLCDISSRFVQHNPRQIRKQVRSVASDVDIPITVIRVTDAAQIGAAVRARIEALSTAQNESRPAPTVYVLGRYNRDAAFAPELANGKAHAAVAFKTVHLSKGLEADHVILPHVVDARYGFPSRIADDSVVRLAMPKGEDFPFAEERRLFYVALTRAKRTVTLITVAGRESPFVIELLRERKVHVVTADRAPADVAVCPACGDGLLVTRQGRHGMFTACSRFPDCTYTGDAGRAAPKQPAVRSPS